MAFEMYHVLSINIGYVPVIVLIYSAHATSLTLWKKCTRHLSYCLSDDKDNGGNDKVNHHSLLLAQMSYYTKRRNRQSRHVNAL